jgi:hypothetical protein
VTYEEMTRFRRSWPWWRWVLTGLNVLALALSAYLGWHYLVGGHEEVIELLKKHGAKE